MQPVRALGMDQSMSATLRANALSDFGVFSESGLAGTGMVHIARPFVLSFFILNHGDRRRAMECRRAIPSLINQVYAASRGVCPFRRPDL